MRFNAAVTTRHRAQLTPMVGETVISDDSGDGSYEDKRSRVGFYSLLDFIS